MDLDGPFCVSGEKMKKFIQILFTALIFLGFNYYLAANYFKNKDTELAQNFNQYNLLAKREPKFVKIDHADAEEENDGSITYYADSYDRQGNYHEIDFNSDDELPNDQLVKLDTRGSYIKDYRFIKSDDLPFKVYRIFNK